MQIQCGRSRWPWPPETGRLALGGARARPLTSTVFMRTLAHRTAKNLMLAMLLVRSGILQDLGLHNGLAHQGMLHLQQEDDEIRLTPGP